MLENIKSKLYKLAIWYIGRCNTKWNKPIKDIEHLKRLTYKSGIKPICYMVLMLNGKISADMMCLTMQYKD